MLGFYPNPDYLAFIGSIRRTDTYEFGWGVTIVDMPGRRTIPMTRAQGGL